MFRATELAFCVAGLLTSFFFFFLQISGLLWIRCKLWSKWQHTLWQSPWHSVHIEFGTFLSVKTYVACKRRLQFCLKFYEIACEPEPLSVMEYTCCVAAGKLNYTMILSLLDRASFW
jgi:hypothetical protein